MGCGQDGRAPGLDNTPSRCTRRESFPCQPGAVEIRRNSESPESLATRCPDALGDLGSDSFWWGEATDEPAREDTPPTEMANCVTTKIGCCMRSAEFTPFERSNS